MQIDAVDHEIGVSETTAELVPGRDADYFTAVARIKHQNGRRMMGRHLLAAIAVAAGVGLPPAAQAGNQKEEALADSVRLALSRAQT